MDGFGFKPQEQFAVADKRIGNQFDVLIFTEQDQFELAQLRIKQLAQVLAALGVNLHIPDMTVALFEYFRQNQTLFAEYIVAAVKQLFLDTVAMMTIVGGK